MRAAKRVYPWAVRGVSGGSSGQTAPQNITNASAPLSIARSPENPQLRRKLITVASLAPRENCACGVAWGVVAGGRGGGVAGRLGPRAGWAAGCPWAGGAGGRAGGRRAPSCCGRRTTLWPRRCPAGCTGGTAACGSCRRAGGEARGQLRRHDVIKAGENETGKEKHGGSLPRLSAHFDHA